MIQNQNWQKNPDGSWSPATPLSKPRTWRWLQRIVDWLSRR